MPRFVFALGIRNVGETVAGLLADHYPSPPALLDAGEEELASIRAEVADQITRAEKEALESPRPGAEDVERFVYSPEVDPTSDDFASHPQGTGESLSMVGLINRCLHDEMSRDPRVVVFGQDVT